METTLKHRLIGAYIGLVCGPLLLVAVITVWQIFSVRQQQAVVRQTEVAAGAANRLIGWLETVQGQIMLASHLDPLLDASPEQQQQVLQSLLSAQPAIQQTSLITLKGHEMLRVNRSGLVDPAQLADWSHDDLFMSAIYSGNIYFSSLNFTPTALPQFTIAVPIKSASTAQPMGVLAATVTLNAWNDLLTAISTDKTQPIYVLDSQNRLLSHSPLAMDEVPSMVVAASQSVVKTGLYGKPAVLGIKDFSLGDHQLRLVAEKNTNDAFAPANRILLIFIVFSLLILLLVALFGWRLMRHILQSVQVVVEGATAITGGDFTARIPRTNFTELTSVSNSLNTLAIQLKENIDTLEKRIYDRTRALQVSMEISNQITIIRNLDSLLEYVVTRIQTGYQFYHTQIYMVDPETEDMVIASGYGDIGLQTKARGYRVTGGEGIVGTVAITNQPFQSNNVDNLINFVHNPFLPLTKSELAVPLRIGSQVIGVLDVHSDHYNRFTLEDVTIMQSLADQTAVVLDNIRLLTETQTTLQEVERLNSRLSRQAWEQFGAEITTSGYRFKHGANTVSVKPTSDAWIQVMHEARQRKHLVHTMGSTVNQESPAEMAVPLVFRGEVIGVMGLKRHQPADWSKEELSAVESIAGQVTLALENARLSADQNKTIGQLQEVDRLKSNFLTNMSHELRTPLNSIIGFADILLQGIDGPISENAITDVTAIHTSGKHLLALINDILDLSKIEAGRMELACNPVNVAHICRDVVSSVSSLLAQKPIDLIEELEPELPPVWADPLRINQIILNLVSNALKFTDEGAVVLGAERYANNMVHVYVQDTGIGIPVDKFSLIFERFRQVDSRSNRKYQGTGMGLAIAWQLVELHGGKMWLESIPGVGSTFHFTVPIYTPDRQN